MKKLALLFLVAAQSIAAQTFEITTLLNNGPNDKRINLVILGDGYTAAQQSSFLTSATEVTNYLFNKAPYSNYKNYFNVHAVKVISAESGVKHPGTAFDVSEPQIPVSNPNNYLGTSYDIGGIHRCVYSNTINKVNQVLAANMPSYDMALIIGNNIEYGGCGGQFAFLSTNSTAPDIALHELGHSFGKLADEYWFAGTGESTNKTQNSNPSTIKWKNWVGLNGVGIYSYAENTAWFRPHQSCEMRYLNQAFCNVCLEGIIEKIHGAQNPIDSYTPANNTTISTTASVNLNVSLILPVPNTLSVTWKLNGATLNTGASSVTITPEQMTVGTNTVNFSVVDNTTNVRVDNHSSTHVSTVVWTINKTTLGVGDIKSKQFDFILYPNPSQDFVYVEPKDTSLGDLRAEIVDMSGRVVSKQDITAADGYKVNLNKLASSTYTLNLYKDQILLMAKKVVKE